MGRGEEGPESGGIDEWARAYKHGPWLIAVPRSTPKLPFFAQPRVPCNNELC